jgi:integrase
MDNVSSRPIDHYLTLALSATCRDASARVSSNLRATIFSSASALFSEDALCLRTRRARRPTTQISELAYRQGTEVDGPDVSVLKKAGLPDIRFHDLRHTCATVLLSEGVNPKFVQELLGHEDIKLTLGTYSHFLPSMGDQIATAMKNVLG